MDCGQFNILLLAWAGTGVIISAVLLFIKAPYGRYAGKKWGPLLRSRTGWVVMELPSPIVFVFSFLAGADPPRAVTWVFFAFYMGHYANRSLVYPFRTHASEKGMPLSVVFMAILFNLLNGFSNGFYFSTCSGDYEWSWLLDYRFILGVILFMGGAVINIWSDQILLNLRRTRGKGYYLPEGGLFRWVSCPNYFGETVEWAGFALMTWSPAALAFAIWTACNLVPRALDHHRWYRHRFPDYPARRKAIIPGIL